MIADEKVSTYEKKQRSSVFDRDAEQEVGAGAAAGDRTAGSQGQVGFVYFIESPDAAYLKIGYTAHSVAARFHEIGCSLPGLRLLGHIPAARATEKWLHAKFADIQERGEWFRYDDRLRTFINHLGIVAAPLIRQNPRKVGRRLHSTIIRLVEPIPQAAIISEPEPVEPPTPEMKNVWAVALGKLAASKRGKEELAEAGRQGGLRKAANRKAQHGAST